MQVNSPPDLSALEAAVQKIDGWLAHFGGSYLGRLPEESSLHKSPVVAGWRFKVLGQQVAIVADAEFPYTRLSVYLCESDGKLHFPHVERSGRLCLPNFVSPASPTAAINSALMASLSLLRENSVGKHVDDFIEDFGLYWTNSTTDEFGECLILREGICPDSAAHYFRRERHAYVFSSLRALSIWSYNHSGEIFKKRRRTAVIEVHPLPTPLAFPENGEALWKLLVERSNVGTEMLGELLRPIPKSLLLILTGKAPSGRRHFVGVELTRPASRKGGQCHWREMTIGYPRFGTPPEVLVGRYELRRLPTKFLDGATTRLPVAQGPRSLADKTVAVVGCGALGSGVSSLLAKAGVGTLILIDHETLGWENIRRHELGSEFVGYGKSQGLAVRLRRQVPDVRDVRHFKCTIEQLLREAPDELRGIDLFVSCTASWGADCAIDDFAHAVNSRLIPVLYGWMEPNGIAAHAVLIPGADSIKSGFDEGGNFRLPASVGGHPPPPECGNTTSVFGSIELATAQSMLARLAVESLNGVHSTSVWRTWLTDVRSLELAGANWSGEWCKRFGYPPEVGSYCEATWP